MVYNWDNDKNLVLKKQRNISFEEIIVAIESGDVVDVLKNPNDEKYKDQILILVRVDDYIYVVPAVEKKDEFFLKTIFPSRKYTDEYIRQRGK